MRLTAIGVIGFVFALLGGAPGASACPVYPDGPYWRPCPPSGDYDPSELRPCPECWRHPSHAEPQPCSKCGRYPSYPQPQPCADCDPYPRPCRGCSHYPPYPSEPYPDTPRCKQKVPKTDPEFGGAFARVREGYLSVTAGRGKEVCHFFRGDIVYVYNRACNRNWCSIWVRQSSFPVDIPASSLDFFRR